MQARSSGGVVASVPLLVSFLLLPLFVSLLQGMTGSGQSISFAHAAPLPLSIIWGVLALFGALWRGWTLARPRAESPSPGQRILQKGEAVLVLLVAGLFFVAVQQWAALHVGMAEIALRWLTETSPLVYLLFAGLWCFSFGVPSLRSFYTLGLGLAVLVVADTVLGAVIHGHLLPAGGFLLLADRELLACLLAVALYAGMDELTDDPAVTVRALRWTDVLLILALCATFSRTALFASACVWIFLGRGTIWLRILFSLAMLAAATVSVLAMLPLTADTVRLEGHLLWMAGVEYFASLPELLLHVQGPRIFSLSLPGVIASNMGLPARTELFYPEQIESLWLRAALVWGGYGPGLLLAGFALPAMARPMRLLSGLVALLLTQGTVSGLLFRPEVAVVLWLALIAGLFFWRPKLPRKEDTEEPWFAIEKRADND